jgi:hypothetical protein
MADSQSLVTHVNSLINEYREEWGSNPSLYEENHERHRTRGSTLHSYINSKAPQMFRSHPMWATITDAEMESVKECLEKFIMVSVLL